ncbi:UNKNOWN [Stylonychia lemnae]|uniref:TRAF-type domain-containing protein n=1 Tax=Stylonychia lemnae TaxID=5949 RepID=A0A077ZT89_STYLE|nr:UNKNOWN [Stylonychia lemnae]|eukprot:CDW72545.1 UNKNOWN [Stylonychia lemnae]
MLCFNVPNKDNASFCSVCRRPVCLKCYEDIFQGHEDSVTYKMPCLCVNSQRVDMIELFHQQKNDFLNLKFKCFISPDCTKILSYQQMLNPNDHIQDCEYSIFRCKYCKIVKSRKEKIKHRFECEDAPRKCKHCARDVKMFRYSEHLRLVHPDIENENSRDANNQGIQQQDAIQIDTSLNRDGSNQNISREQPYKRAKMNDDDYVNKEDKNGPTKYQQYMQSKITQNNIEKQLIEIDSSNQLTNQKTNQEFRRDKFILKVKIANEVESKINEEIIVGSDVRSIYSYEEFEQELITKKNGRK